ncbi:hypothetical protein EDC04DRAFT_2777504, partial [Pisolithus marmoratus]
PVGDTWPNSPLHTAMLYRMLMASNVVKSCLASALVALSLLVIQCSWTCQLPSSRSYHTKCQVPCFPNFSTD